MKVDLKHSSYEAIKKDVIDAIGEFDSEKLQAYNGKNGFNWRYLLPDERWLDFKVINTE